MTLVRSEEVEKSGRLWVGLIMVITAIVVVLAVMQADEVLADSCTVTYDSGKTYTSDTNCEDYYPATHPCSASTDRPDRCGTQDMYHVIDLDTNDVNIINNAKKGLWSVDIYSKSTGTTNDGITSDTTSCIFPVTDGERAPNSLRAVVEAYKAGWKSVEIDTQLVFDSYVYEYYAAKGSTYYDEAYEAWTNSSNSVTVIGHAEDYWSFTSYEGTHLASIESANKLGYTWNTSALQFEELNLSQYFLLNQYFEEPGTDSILDAWWKATLIPYQLSIYNYNTANAPAYMTDLVIMLDPKNPRNPQPNVVFKTDDSTGETRYSTGYSGPIIEGIGSKGCVTATTDTSVCAKSQILRQLDEIASYLTDADNSISNDVLAMVVLKSPLEYSVISAGIEETGQGGVTNWDKFSWVAMTPNGDAVADADDYLTFIDDWMTGASTSVLFVDTNIPGPDSWQANSFSWDGTTFDASGTDYADVTDYIMTKYGKRSQWWPPTPQKPLGVIGKYWTEAQIKPNDLPYSMYTAAQNEYFVDHSFMAPDPAQHMTEKYASKAVVTHDRPDIFLQIRNQGLGATSGYGCSDSNSSSLDD